MQFTQLNLKDKLIFEKFLSTKEHGLSAYAFENIFIWKSIYDIFWTKINENLCIFFRDKVGCFLYLPPQGSNLNKDVISKCFEIMNHCNKNSIISRIENIEKKEIDFYKKLGYKVISPNRDYICKKEDLMSLKGNQFKKKRTLINFFEKNYDFKYQPFDSKDKTKCIDLYKSWMRERKAKNSDSIYQKLIEDNFLIFKVTLDYYGKLNFIGRIVKIDGKIKAMTFGYPIGKESFVILFEVCDLNFKGIAQYIFREFCKELDYKDFNIMDDSGLDNLKRVKLSYRPYKIEENFIIYQ